MVEQRTENPCVGGSIPPLATTICKDLQLIISFVINQYIIGSNSISNTKKQIASRVRVCVQIKNLLSQPLILHSQTHLHNLPTSLLN